ncbi:hypothetical protein, partial [Neoasaia chiangmaiensis]
NPKLSQSKNQAILNTIRQNSSRTLQSKQTPPRPLPQPSPPPNPLPSKNKTTWKWIIFGMIVLFLVSKILG